MESGVEGGVDGLLFPEHQQPDEPVASHVTGLGESQNSYLDFVRSLRPHGEKFARFIKRDGFCFGHYTDCWKRTYFSGNNPEWGPAS